MKAGQNDKCDITKTPGIVPVCLQGKLKNLNLNTYIVWLQSCQPGAKVVPKFDCKIENSKTKYI